MTAAGTLIIDATCAPVNLSQPYIRPIVRGKAKSPVEFGIKFDLLEYYFLLFSRNGSVAL